MFILHIPTANERKEVAQFFTHSETSLQPVVSELYSIISHVHLQYRYLYIPTTNFSPYVYTIYLIYHHLLSTLRPPLNTLFACIHHLHCLSLSVQRRKTKEGVFVPTSLKNLLVTGVFGHKVKFETFTSLPFFDLFSSLCIQTTHMMSHFPINYVNNVGKCVTIVYNACSIPLLYADVSSN